MLALPPPSSESLIKPSLSTPSAIPVKIVTVPKPRPGSRMSLALECIWKCSFAILVLVTLIVKAEDSVSDDTALDKRNYNHMFVGKRFNHMFVGKRFNHMFVGKRFNHMFVGKRFNHMFVGKRNDNQWKPVYTSNRPMAYRMFPEKRFNHMFVGKRDNKQLQPNQWKPVYSNLPTEYRMFPEK